MCMLVDGQLLAVRLDLGEITGGYAKPELRAR